jgi:hypothetical protein
VQGRKPKDAGDDWRSRAERERILGLAEDLPALWHASTTTAAERKQLPRFLVQDVTLTKHEGAIALAIRWQTQACTRAEVPRPPRACDARRTPAAVVERVRPQPASRNSSILSSYKNPY